MAVAKIKVGTSEFANMVSLRITLGTPTPFERSSLVGAGDNAPFNDEDRRRMARPIHARQTRVVGRWPSRAWFRALVAGTLLGCLGSPGEAASVNAQTVVDQYAVIVQASYEDALATAQSMQKRINGFVANPDNASLEAAKTSWRAAREWYGQTEAFRFYGGPIDDAKGPEPRINSWPVDESYIDRVRGNPTSGIINDPAIPITKNKLAALNTSGGQENIATGWHAIEFLLWGQDFNDDGPGDRSFEDFVDGKTVNAGRRRQYLKVVTEQLIDDMTYVARAWRVSGHNY